jgi:tetratricopeptide (TPR) repeat protein
MQIPRFISQCILSLLLPALVAQPLYGMQDEAFLKNQTYQDPLNDSKQISYDEVLQFLEDIESGALESLCHDKDLEAINAWLITLARAGVIPGDIEAESTLEQDIESLCEDGVSFTYGFYEDQASFMLIPQVTASHFEAFICKSWLKKQWKQTKKFVKDHKKEILIGAAIVVGAAVIVAAVSYSVGAAAASAAASSAASLKDSHKDSSCLDAASVYAQTDSIRKDVLQKDLVQLTDTNFPMEENARILGKACAQAAFNKLQNNVYSNAYFSSDLQKMGGLKPESCYLIDQAFAKPIPWYFWDYSTSFKENVYVARGTYALDIKSYDQAFSDFGKVLELNKNNADVYLHRALTYFETGQIDKATEDFKQHVKLRQEPLQAVKEFSLGFASGLSKGAKDSGRGLYEFGSDLLFHPISTASKMYESGQMLFELTKSADWAEIAHCLSPEAYELATCWEKLSYERRGELSGYVFGKHGTDLIIPGAGIKRVKGAVQDIKLIAGIINSASKAEKTLVLESMALGTGKVADASFSVKTAAGVKDLGEIGFLKHVEHLKANQMFNFTEAPLVHMKEPARWVPMNLMKEVIEHPLAVLPDPRKATSGNMYYSQISRNGKLYNIEVLYDPLNNTIYHFKYDPGPLGPLNKASLYEK